MVSPFLPFDKGENRGDLPGVAADEIPPSLLCERGVAWRARHAQKGFLNMHYSSLQINVWQSRNRKRSRWPCLALTPPSPSGRGGIGTG